MIWKKADGQKATLVSAVVAGGYRWAKEDWPSVQEAPALAMVRLEQVLRPHLQVLV